MRKILYFSLVQSHMTNGILAWGFNTTNIFKSQKKAIRIITKSQYFAHTDPLFKNLGILKIEDLFKLNILKFYYQMKQHCLPFDISTRSEIHSYDTRNKRMLNTVKTRLKSTENCLRFELLKLINSTDPLVLDKVNLPIAYLVYLCM